MAFTNAERAREVDSGQTIDSVEQMDGVAAMQKGVDIYRPSELDLCLWVTYMKTKQFQYKTIKSYVSAVATELKMKGRQCPVLSEAWYYQKSMRGILRTVGEGQGTRRRALAVDMLPAFFSK